MILLKLHLVVMDFVMLQAGFAVEKFDRDLDPGMDALTKAGQVICNQVALQVFFAILEYGYFGLA